MSLGAFTGSSANDAKSANHYWPTALILMAVSSFSFYAAGFSPTYFLSLANAALFFSGLATLLFINSWRIKRALITKTFFWSGFLVFWIFYEFMRQSSSFDTRVLLMISLITAINIWGIAEIIAQSKNEKSRHFYVLALALIFQISSMLLRVYVSGSTHPSVMTIFQEDELPALVRGVGLASNLLVYIAIGNILLERLWRQEEKKSISAELKMLSSLNALALARDNETGSHIVRTQNYVKTLAKRLRQEGHYLNVLSEKMIDSLYRASPLHDIGKVGIPDNILYKDGPLNKDEWGIMKTHTNIGEFVLSSAKSQIKDDSEKDDVIQTAIEIAGSHHERWDGQGYPRGLSGQDIPLAARIMALADMYDALVSERVYKPEWRHEDAVQEIINKKGLHFDPLVVDAFFKEKEVFEEIAKKNKDDQAEFKVFNGINQSNEHKLRRAEEKFELLFEHSPIGMALIDHGTGEFLEVNAALLAYTGYSKQEFLKLSFWDITPSEYRDQEEQQIRDLNEKGSFGPNEKEYIRKDGSRLPISLRGFILNDVDGRKLVWGIIEDISLKKKAYKQEQARNAVLEMLAKNSPKADALMKIVSDVEAAHPNTFCSVLLLNEDKKSFSVGAAPRIPQYFNEAVELLTIGPGVGCCGDAVSTGLSSIAENLDIHPNWADAKSLIERVGFKSCWSHPIYSSEGEILGTFATYRKEIYSPSIDEISEIEAASNLVSIVLERKNLESQVQKLALYDYLTGLPNRYLLMDRIKLAMTISRRNKRYGALLFIDLDKLKQLNDEYGHHVGDLLLQESAHRIQSCIRESDTVARFGGDEFVIVLSEISPDYQKAVDQVKIISEKILASLIKLYYLKFDGKIIKYQSSASIGTRLFFDESETAESLLKHADISMYRAKRMGGNLVDMPQQNTYFLDSLGRNI